MKISLCFVCLGNICRSPTAEGIMLDLVARAGLDGRVLIDSAGTGAWHVGERADPRSRACAEARGIALPSISRQFERADFARFDYVLAMDRENRDDLLSLAAGVDATAKVHLLRSFGNGGAEGPDVPDPYYGGERGFDDVFDICHEACRGLLEHLVATHGLAR